MSTYAPFAKPLYVMLKPVGAVCNLACDYCYYLEKSKLYVNNPKHVMSDELLEKFIEEYINSQTMPQVLFTWHGGETLMRPLAFYKKAMELQGHITDLDLPIPSFKEEVESQTGFRITREQMILHGICPNCQ